MQVIFDVLSTMNVHKAKLANCTFPPHFIQCTAISTCCIIWVQL